MHVEDVTSLAVSPTGDYINVITLASSAIVIKVEGYKQNIQITGAIRSMDASAKMDINVIFKLPLSSGYGGRMQSLLSGEFYVLAEEMRGSHKFFGHISPLECSGLDWDSNSNVGLATVTLSAPEGSAGNYFMALTAPAIQEIKRKVGV